MSVGRVSADTLPKNTLSTLVLYRPTGCRSLGRYSTDQHHIGRYVVDRVSVGRPTPIDTLPLLYRHSADTLPTDTLSTLDQHHINTRPILYRPTGYRSVEYSTDRHPTDTRPILYRPTGCRSVEYWPTNGRVSIGKYSGRVSPYRHSADRVGRYR